MRPPRSVPETATDARSPDEASGRRPPASRRAGKSDAGACLPRFVVRNGTSERRFGLRLDDRVLDLGSGLVTVGRAPECEVATDDPLLSRRHATLAARPSGVLVVDLRSTNGVYVNGVRINGEVLARPADWISLGVSTLEVVEIEGAPALRPADEEPASKPPSQRRRATQPGSALMVIAGVAERALAAEKSHNGEQILNSPLDGVLKAALSGRRVDPADAQMAAVLASRLAEAAGGGRWARYCFELFAALRRPLPTQAIDRLYRVFHQAGPEEVAELERYLRVLQTLSYRSLGAEGLALVNRISGLRQLVP